MLTPGQRYSMAEDIIAAMRKRYQEEGEEGDFDAGFVYLRDDASNAELQQEHSKWCK